MSLINDALKKAKQAQQQNPSPLAAEQFRSVESEQRRSNLIFLLPVAVVLLSAAGGAFVWMALQKSGAIQHETVLARQREAATQRNLPPTPVAPPAQSAAAQKIESAPAEVQKAATLESNPQPPTNQVQQVATEPAQPVLPTLRGIFYNPSRPSAVLNKKTVFVGDSVAGFRVMAISTESVTITGAGQTNVLTLPE